MLDGGIDNLACHFLGGALSPNLQRTLAQCEKEKECKKSVQPGPHIGV